MSHRNIPTVVFCAVFGCSLVLRPSAAIIPRHHARREAFANLGLLGNTPRSDERWRENLCRHRHALTPCGRRRRRDFNAAEEWKATASGEASGGSDEGEGGRDLESGAYFPTEALLEDPSHVERILADMNKLSPAVEPVDDPVFSAAAMHHCAVRTANIVRAIKFYSLLGMEEVVRFRADSARCAFLEGAGMRMELIEVPASMQPADKAADLAADMRSTGLNHIAFDVGAAVEAKGLDGLRGFLSELNKQSEEIFGMSVRLAVSPFEQRMGQDVYDIAFIADADGVLLELLHHKLTLDVDMPQAW